MDGTPSSAPSIPSGSPACVILSVHHLEQADIAEVDMDMEEDAGAAHRPPTEEADEVAPAGLTRCGLHMVGSHLHLACLGRAHLHSSPSESGPTLQGGSGPVWTLATDLIDMPDPSLSPNSTPPPAVRRADQMLMPIALVPGGLASCGALTLTACMHLQPLAKWGAQSSVCGTSPLKESQACCAGALASSGAAVQVGASQVNPSDWCPQQQRQQSCDMARSGRPGGRLLSWRPLTASGWPSACLTQPTSHTASWATARSVPSQQWALL